MSKIVRIYPSSINGYKAEIRDMKGTLIKSCKMMGEAWGYCRENGLKASRYNEPFNPEDVVHTREVQSFPVERRFGFMNRMIEMIARNVAAGAIICGPPGIGKTHSCLSVLKGNGMKEDRDYIFIKGNTSAMGLYRTLYFNNDKMIVFDDCDNALFDPGCANLLKSALDTCDKRRLSWVSQNTANGSAGVPESFEFEGRILFISNMPESRIDRAIVSRTMCMDLKMNKVEIMDRIEQLASSVCVNIDPIQTTEVITWMKDNMDNLADLNLRTLIKLSKLRQTAGDDWMDMATYSFCR